MTTYSTGFGRTYRNVPSYEIAVGRRTERTTTLTVGENNVTIIVRDAIVPEDPYLNLVRGAAYQVADKGPFPVPPVSRNVKDFLIKLGLE